MVLGVALRPEGFPLLAAAVVVGTAGWFFFYAIFALAIRRNDAFNTVTSIFYFVFLFASSMFYPIDPLPAAFRIAALANPITWHVDVMRFATIGLGNPRLIALEAAGFVVFTLLSFAGALVVLRRQGEPLVLGPWSLGPWLRELIVVNLKRLGPSGPPHQNRPEGKRHLSACSRSFGPRRGPAAASGRQPILVVHRTIWAGNH